MNDLTSADINRAYEILICAAERTLQTANRRLMNKNHNGRKATVCTFESAIKQHCGKILQAAKTKPGILKAIDDLADAKKRTRKELSAELKNGKKKLREINKRIEELSMQYTAIQKCSNINNQGYPDVPPPMVEINTEGEGLPSTSGIYFIWDNGIIVYVGQSIKLSQRLRLYGHHAIKSGEWISYVEIEKYDLHFAESYYIGTVRPIRNFGLTGSHNIYPKTKTCNHFIKAHNNGT